MIIFEKKRELENHYDLSSLRMEVDAVCLDEILSEFEAFLRGCGYIFEGSLEIVEGEDDVCKSE